MPDDVALLDDAQEDLEGEAEMPEISDATRAMSDAELLEALRATEMVHVHIIPPASVHDEMRTYAAHASTFPVDGKRINITQGGLLAFIWQHFLDTYGLPQPEIAEFVAQFRADYDERRAEAINRGLIAPTPAERARGEMGESDGDQDRKEDGAKAL